MSKFLKVVIALAIVLFGVCMFFTMRLSTTHKLEKKIDVNFDKISYKVVETKGGMNTNASITFEDGKFAIVDNKKSDKKKDNKIQMSKDDINILKETYVVRKPKNAIDGAGFTGLVRGYEVITYYDEKGNEILKIENNNIDGYKYFETEDEAKAFAKVQFKNAIKGKYLK